MVALKRRAVAENRRRHTHLRVWPRLFFFAPAYVRFTPENRTHAAQQEASSLDQHPNALDRNCNYFDQAEQRERPSQKSDRNAIPPTNSAKMIR
jgi:hypothetical protein